MMELKDTIKQMAAQLKEVDAILLNAVNLSSPVVPKSCYVTWQKRSQYHQYLAEVLNLLQVRENACEAMYRLSKEASDVTASSGHEFHYCDSPVSFSSARFLTLQNYVTTAWVVYDKLANVCARIIGPASIGNDDSSKRNAKLDSAFFPDKKADKKSISSEQGVDLPTAKDETHLDRPNGFALQTLLACQWSWPVKVSYKIRNLVVHEGMRWTDGCFFRGDSPGDGFKMSDRLKSYLDNACGKQVNGGERRRECLSRMANEDGFPWYGDDVRIILKKCHSEIDILFSTLLQWCIPAFCSQVMLFSEPDKISLAPWMENNG
ncbi:MAG: hypothetical protein IKM62_01830 [Kiritimatiellae bacterium]|nr:hypothetical protein [Kiritimatiellia bacterium]